MQTATPLWLSDNSVATRYAVSRVTIWRWTKAGQFPKPCHIGLNTTRWSVAELNAHDKRVMQAMNEAA